MNFEQKSNNKNFLTGTCPVVNYEKSTMKSPYSSLRQDNVVSENINRLKNFTTGMKSKKLLTLILPALTYFALYGISFAQTSNASVCSISGNPTLKTIIVNLIIGCILTRTAYLIVAAAVVVFLYGIFKFISSEGDDKQGGRELMFWGIIGIFVMTSFWGLAAILQNTFNF